MKLLNIKTLVAITSFSLLVACGGGGGTATQVPPAQNITDETVQDNSSAPGEATKPAPVTFESLSDLYRTNLGSWSQGDYTGFSGTEKGQAHYKGASEIRYETLTKMDPLTEELTSDGKKTILAETTATVDFGSNTMTGRVHNGFSEDAPVNVDLNLQANLSNGQNLSGTFAGTLDGTTVDGRMTGSVMNGGDLIHGNIRTDTLPWDRALGDTIVDGTLTMTPGN